MSDLVGREVDGDGFPSGLATVRPDQHSTDVWAAPLPDRARQRTGRTRPRIAAQVGCDDQTMLDALHAFNAQGLAALQQGSSPPHHPPPRAFAGERAEQLWALSRRGPRELGHPTSLWTLDLAAQVSCVIGLSPRQVSGETIHQALQRLGVSWRRAKQWITHPDLEYARKLAALPGRRCSSPKDGRTSTPSSTPSP